MDKTYFKMQCERLAVEIRCSDDINSQGFLTPLWNYFSKINQKRFAEAVEYICETWHYRKFPLRADFNDALKRTSRPNTYKQTPLNDDISECSADLLSLAEKYKAPVKKRQLIKQATLRRQMKEKGFVYSLTEEKWVSADDKNVVGGNFIEP